MYNKRYKYIYLFLVIFGLLIFSSNKVFAAIVISEISPSSDPEWVKLYNDGDDSVILDGYLLKDGNSLDSDDLHLTGTILSKGYLTFNHNKGWLNDDKDTIRLYDNSSPSAMISEYFYPTPTPVKILSPTPESTKTATSTPTTSPVPTIVSTPKPIIKTQTPKATQTSELTEVPKIIDAPIAITDSIQTSSPEPAVLGDKSESQRVPLMSYALIISGFGFLGYVGYLIYNQRHAKL